MLGFTCAASAGLSRLRYHLGWLAAGLLLLALDAGAAQRSLRFERISIEQGLSQQSAMTILQDRQGFIWIGTQAGLNRFDGYRMTVYRNDPNDPGSLPDNYVAAAYEDKEGRLWFGTKGGLARFDPASGRFYRHTPAGAGGDPRRSAASAVYAIVAAPGGAMWAATSDGLLHFDPASERFRAYRHDPGDPHSLRDNRVSSLAVDGRGALWIGTAAGLDKLAPGSERFEHFAIEPAADAQRNTVLSLSMGPRDTLWIGTAAGLEAWRLDEAGPRRQPLGAESGLQDVRILRLYHDEGAQLWVGTDNGGLAWRDPASGRFVPYRHAPQDQHSLSDDRVHAILVDRTGTLWVGTFFGGVNRTDLASGGFVRYSEAGGLGRAKVRAIVDDGAGRLWIGTTGEGLLRLDPASGRAEPAPGGHGDVVTSLARARGVLWIGTPTGLLRRDPGGRIVPITLAPAPAANFVHAIRAGRDGTVWVVTRGGLFELDQGGALLRHWRHEPGNPSSLGDNYGFAVLEDRQGIIWVGTETGLERLDRRTGRFTRYRHDPRDPATLRHSRVYYLAESARGELWIGTAGGLHRMERQGEQPRFRFYPFARGQEALPIGAVLEDDTGVLWASTTAGITRVDPESGQIKNYTAKDGLIDGSYFVGSGWRSPDGQLHFGGIAGMTTFRPELVRDNPYPPTVVFTDLLVLNRSRAVGNLAEQREITLSHRDAVFALEFAALHFADPQGNRYAYQLEGFDQGWVDTDARRRFATYTNLDPGRYVFRVRASNKDGLWSTQAATLAITITPPWWKTWWLRTLAVLLVLALSYLAYRLRVRVLVRQKGVLEREVSARTAELLLEKEAAERGKREVERQKESVERAHRELKETQAQLAAHEKLASLGSLVAGVAHELNTPIGNSLLMASSLQEKTHEVAERFDQGSLRRSDLADYMSASREAADLMVRSLHNAAELVSSFRQVSVDQASAQRRRFDLAQVCHEITATLMNTVRLAGHQLQLEVPAGIAMDGFPGPLGQVVVNFVNNAMLHAFDTPGGTMVLSAQADGEMVRMAFRDNGRGIAPEHLARIFDPFFTTRMGQGGTGLGLNIAYNIVTSLLGGTIRVDSVPGQGTVFVLELPLTAPAVREIAEG